MEIDTRIVDDKVIVTLRGPVTGAELKDAVEDLMRRGYRQSILDLRDVGALDSEGLGAIVRASTSVSRQGGTLKLRNLTKRIRDLLSITKLLEPPPMEAVIHLGAVIVPPCSRFSGGEEIAGRSRFLHVPQRRHEQVPARHGREPTLLLPQGHSGVFSGRVKALNFAPATITRS